MQQQRQQQMAEGHVLAAGVCLEEAQAKAGAAATAPSTPCSLHGVSGTSRGGEDPHQPAASRQSAWAGETPASSPAGAPDAGGISSGQRPSNGGSSSGGRKAGSSTGMCQPHSQPQPHLMFHRLAMQDYSPRRSLSRPVGRTIGLLPVSGSEASAPASAETARTDGATAVALAQTPCPVHACSPGAVPGALGAAETAAPAMVAAPGVAAAVAEAGPSQPGPILQQPVTRANCTNRLAQLVLGGQEEEADQRPMGHVGPIRPMGHARVAGTELGLGPQLCSLGSEAMQHTDLERRSSALVSTWGSLGGAQVPTACDSGVGCRLLCSAAGGSVGGGSGAASETGISLAVDACDGGSRDSPSTPALVFRRVHDTHEARTHRFLASADGIPAVAMFSPGGADPSITPACRAAALLRHTSSASLSAGGGGAVAGAALGAWRRMEASVRREHGIILRTGGDTGGWDLLATPASRSSAWLSGAGGGSGSRRCFGGTGNVFTAVAPVGDGRAYHQFLASAELGGLLESTMMQTDGKGRFGPTHRPMGHPERAEGQAATACSSFASSGPAVRLRVRLGLGPLGPGLGGSAASRAQHPPMYVIDPLSTAHSGSGAPTRASTGTGIGTGSGGRAGPLLRMQFPTMTRGAAAAATAATAVGMGSLWLPAATDAALVLGVEDEDLLGFADGS